MMHIDYIQVLSTPMYATSLLNALVPLLEDLSRELPEGERYRRLLQATRALLPADAVALLRLEGDSLIPLGVDGLSNDTLGRRFRVAEHPRFQILLAADGPWRFPADSDLPDPYDGLVEGKAGQLEVHDCMGCALHVDGQPWGLLTLDALSPDRFSDQDTEALRAFAVLACATVSAASHIHRLSRRVQSEYQRAELYRAAARKGPRALLGQSAAHMRLMEEIEIVGASQLSVLISGETGTGKELVTEALHAASPRANSPMVSVNCAALPENLVESELFGHVRGAFSGATADRRGKFEMADGGTLFLDEVGELPLPVQAKLLRVLQSGQLQRLGSDRDHKVDVRLIAATNRDLAEEVKQHRFRADLYHRLSVYPLRVPPLRERGRDVLLLCGRFLEEDRSRLGLRGLRLGSDAQAALLAYDWPGNVRELEHLVARTALKAMANVPRHTAILTLAAADFDLPGCGTPGLGLAGAPDRFGDMPASPPLPALPPHAPGVPYRAAIENHERSLIEAGLLRNDNNWAACARDLGLNRANLNRIAKRLGLKE
jgi:anaerobic nitric oxide reductase transcription regulator